MHHYPERDDDDELFENWGRRKPPQRRRPPLVAGGQGRSARDVRNNATGAGVLVGLLLVAVAFAGAIWLVAHLLTPNPA